MSEIDWKLRAEAAESALSASKAREEALVEGLNQCAQQFEFYEQQHMAKSPPDLAKAETNGKMAALCRALLSSSKTGA